MVDKLADIPLKDCKTIEEMDETLRKHLGIGFAECAQVLSDAVAERAEELVEDMLNMAPYGDYDKITEDKAVMLAFLKEEATKPENWEIQFMDAKKDSQLMELVFFNKSVDDGDILKGFVFIGLSGKIRHAFPQVSS